MSASHSDEFEFNQNVRWRSSIVSYARNQEDVLLQRAFADINHGFYVDVGAFLPQVDSNTFALYRAGWMGLIVEPMLCVMDNALRLWQRERPRDKIIAGLAGKANGRHPFWLCNALQMSTGSEAMIKQWTASAEVGPPLEVPVYSLNDLLDGMVQNGYAPLPDIHLLSIDVEGMEDEVLAGLDLDKYRPWLIVIECMKPGTHEVMAAEWTLKLDRARYAQVYEDGSNEWYVAREHWADLQPKLKYPPNSFDNWMTARQAELEKRDDQTDRTQW